LNATGVSVHPERDERIDARRAPRRQECGGKSGHREDHEHGYAQLESMESGIQRALLAFNPSREICRIRLEIPQP
jgi:hypothetical protein